MHGSNYDDSTQIMLLMKAGDNGIQAFYSDRTRRDNPYPANTALHEQWDTSFCQTLHEAIANPTFWTNHEYK